jgi:hypothetical protein
MIPSFRRPGLLPDVFGRRGCFCEASPCLGTRFTLRHARLELKQRETMTSLLEYSREMLHEF